ncbi:hypothetical protein ERJ75_000561800 [Trypanosoma vivax]|nr:hypothetical protein ERJ75_000561800 [Trypanosoma vivax]
MERPSRHKETIARSRPQDEEDTYLYAPGANTGRSDLGEGSELEQDNSLEDGKRKTRALDRASGTTAWRETGRRQLYTAKRKANGIARGLQRGADACRLCRGLGSDGRRIATCGR